MPHSELLSGLPLLAGIDPAERELVAACFETVTFEFGENVVTQDEPSTAYFVIAAGRARVLWNDADGTEVAVDILESGAGFGELGLVERVPQSTTVRASSATLTALRLDASVFRAVLRIHPNLLREYVIRSDLQRRADLLRRHKPFTGLPHDAVLGLVEVSTEIVVDDAKVLSNERGLYLVTAGRLASADLPLHAGDVFGTNGRTEVRGTAQLMHLGDQALTRLRNEHPRVATRLDERAALVARRRQPAETVSSPTEMVEPPTDEQLLERLAEHDTGQFPTPARRRRRRFPVVRQIDIADCGAACVATLCRYYGHDISLPAIRAAVGTGIDGTSLRGLLRGGAEIGIEFRAIKTSPERLAEIELPLVLHWGGNHWVVLFRVARGRATIGDPGRGVRIVDEADLAKEWTGYAAIPTPTERLADAPRGGLALGWLTPLAAAHRRALAIAVALAVVATILEMALPVLTQTVFDALLDQQGPARVSVVVAGILLALAGAVGATVCQRRILARVATAIDGSALDYIAERILRLPLGYFQVRRTADIQRRLEGMREIRRVFVEDGVVALTASIQLVVALVVLACYSWTVALLFLLVMPVYGILMRYSRRRLKPVFDSLEEAFGRYQSKQLDAIRGIEVVKVSGAEASFRQTLLREFDGLTDKLYRRDATVMVYDALVSLATLGIVALFLWVGALLTIDGRLTIGELVAVNTLVLLANAPVRILLALWDELQMVGVLLARLQDIHKHDPEQDGQPLTHFDGHVRISGVGFRHRSSPDHRILADISLDVPAGSTVALVGRSGSGKSTLLRCLAGLLIPTDGRIEYDGVDLRELDLRDLRSRIGFVLQEPYLFDATIAENIAFGEAHPDLDRIRQAAAIANAADFVERLPLGYGTRVGDSGLRLSAGQQQRLAIARAVYGRPRVLLMDEPTSALDTESERAVKEGIDRLLRGRTVFIAAHRLSTIRDADLICVLEQGRLVEFGTHDELIGRDGLYRYLTSQQLAE